jgi:RNA polymerase-binding transcription factor DksA/2-polyprenyl-3-methyl-5-hydroxy-6-metoxy-1,4-benzoquinol methylase
MTLGQRFRLAIDWRRPEAIAIFGAESVRDAPDLAVTLVSLPPSSFARDAATAEYYDQRAPEYDEWYEGEGQFQARDRPGWRQEVEQLTRWLGHLPPARTLDVACGTGYLTRYLGGAVVGLDQSRAMVTLARERAGLGAAALGDALNLPFADGSFERVVTGHFYGHLPVPERTAFLAEARRVAPELIVIDSAWRPGMQSEQWQPRVLNDGSRHQVFKRYLRPERLAEEIGGSPTLAGSWFVVARRGPQAGPETSAPEDESGLHDRLDAERASTLARLGAMTAEHEGIMAASVDTNADDEHDPEGSTIAFERARVAALVAQARAHLDDLDRAVARLDNGTYAVCERCGLEITAERLSARPATRTCIRCAAMLPTR